MGCGQLLASPDTAAGWGSLGECPATLLTHRAGHPGAELRRAAWRQEGGPCLPTLNGDSQRQGHRSLPFPGETRGPFSLPLPGGQAPQARPEGTGGLGRGPSGTWAAPALGWHHRGQGPIAQSCLV